MRVTIKIENDGSVHTVERVVVDKASYLELLSMEWDHAVQLESIDKHLVLTGLDLSRSRANVIPYIKAIRNGSNLGLKEAKDLVEASLVNKGILKISREYYAGIIKECDAAGLSAKLLNANEFVCHEVMES